MYWWTSLVAQWLRIHLLMQETWVQSLIWEDDILCEATKPSAPQLLKPAHPRAHAPQQEKPPQ